MSTGIIGPATNRPDRAGDVFLRLIVAMTVAAVALQFFCMGHADPGGPPGLGSMNLLGLMTIVLLAWVLAQPGPPAKLQH